MSVIKIDGVPIPTPSDFTIERYNLTKSGRVASGKMTMELVAKKRKFLFRYAAISGSELQRILNLIDTNKMFFTLTYPDVNGKIDSAVVYVGSIQHKLAIKKPAGEELWVDVQFDLIEQ